MNLLCRQEPVSPISEVPGALVPSPKRILRGRTPPPVSCFQDPRDVRGGFTQSEEVLHTGEVGGTDGSVPATSPLLAGLPAFPKGSREWDKNDPTPTLESNLPGSMEKSPLRHVLVSGGSASEPLPPEVPPQPPAVDHAELRQTGEAYPGNPPPPTSFPPRTLYVVCR